MNNKEDPYFRIALRISIILHILILATFYFGLPNFFDKLPEEQIITFEMVPASAINNIKTQEEKKKGKEEQKAKKIKQSKAVEKEPDVKPDKEEKQPEKTTPEKTKSEPKPAEEPTPAKEAESEVKLPKEEPKKKEPEKKKEDKVKDKKPDNKKKKEDKDKKVKKQNTDPLDTLLKNLEDASSGTTADSAFRAIENTDLDDNKFAKGSSYDENSPLSITEKMLIMRQIEENWRPPVGAQDLENVKVLLHISLNEDASVREVVIKSVQCPTGAKSTCQLAAESAERAVWQADPFKGLSTERYDTWKEFDLNFDPSSLSQ